MLETQEEISTQRQCVKIKERDNFADLIDECVSYLINFLLYCKLVNERVSYFII